MAVVESAPRTARTTGPSTGSAVDGDSPASQCANALARLLGYIKAGGGAYDGWRQQRLLIMTWRERWLPDVMPALGSTVLYLNSRRIIYTESTHALCGETQQNRPWGNWVRGTAKKDNNILYGEEKRNLNCRGKRGARSCGMAASPAHSNAKNGP